jgi:hypothetical protein
MLRRGQLAMVTSATSNSNIEEALLRALRAILPVAEFSRRPEVFLGISGRETDGQAVARALRWISRALYPSNTIAYSKCVDSAVTVFLAATGIAFPYSPSSRRLSMNLDELEPESDDDDYMAITLGLDQME